MCDFAVFWLSEAVQEKDEVVDYIGSHNLLAALAVDEAINRLYCSDAIRTVSV